MWNYINTGEALILTLSKVKLTLMILLCSGALAVPINASVERARGTVCMCKGAYCTCYCVRVKICPSTHIWRQHECASTNIKQRSWVSFLSCLPLSINCSYKAAPGPRLISQCEQSLSAQTPSLAGPAWLSMAQQDLATLLGPKGKHASAIHPAVDLARPL